MTKHISLVCILLSSTVILLFSGHPGFHIDARKVLLDSKGVPWVDYSDIAQKRDNGTALFRNPVTISNYSEWFYDRFVNSSTSEDRDSFMNNANWLVNNAVQLNTSGIEYAIFEYEFEFPQYNLTPPWFSSMAHGMALPHLFNAYKLTNNNTYLEMAQLLLNSFFVTTHENGGTIILPNNTGWWYEEYSGRGAPANGSRVLNGMIHAVLGIYEYYNSTHNPTAKYLFDQGVLALKNNIHTYDYRNGTWSYYDGYRFELAPLIPYQKNISKLLNELYNTTHEEIFKTYRDKWNKPVSLDVLG